MAAPRGGSGGRPGGKPAGRSAGKFDGKTAGKPAGKSSGRPSGNPAGKFSGKPAGKFDGKSSVRPAGKTAGKFAGRPSGKSAGRPSGTFARPSGTAGRPASRPQGKPQLSGGSLVEGRRAVEEALDCGVPVLRALVAAAQGPEDPSLVRLVARVSEQGIPVERVPRGALDSISSHGAHQGIVLEVKPYSYATIERVIEAAGTGPALVVVLDHVTDEGNFGAIVRSAEVVGAAGVVIAKARAARVGVGAYKTSAGAVMHVPIAQVSNLPAALEALKAAGFWVGGATEHAEQNVWEAPLEGRVALVMGSEGEGISRLVRDGCDFECRLPQRGRVESLNVAQAATVMAYEWMRRTYPEGGATE